MAGGTREGALKPAPPRSGVSLERGDVVRLKEPLVRGRPSNGGCTEPIKYTHGVVAEIVSEEYMWSAGAGDPPERVPRTVSLFLFDPASGRILLDPGAAARRGIPTLVGYRTSELVLVQKHDEDYNVQEGRPVGGR